MFYQTYKNMIFKSYKNHLEHLLKGLHWRDLGKKKQKCKF